MAGKRKMLMSDVPHSTLETFLAACHDVARRRLVRCSSGNFSLRCDTERFLITASRSWLEDVAAAQVCVCAVADGRLLAGEGRPSVETRFHAGVLRTRPDANAVLHCQSPHATAVACRRDRLCLDTIPEIPFYMGRVAWVPYLAPGSEALADAVVAAMRDADAALLDHHGQVVVGHDVATAIQNAEFLELACEVALLGGPSVTPLPPDGLAALRALHAGKATAGSAGA
jgi:ribulose-5-phosphate 4-epimerase/fuculose-1-phosphate aldolase